MSTLLHSPLLTPFSLNERLQLKNRIVMAPMTRVMADLDGSPTPMMRDYYLKRANAGLIITEGTIINPTARGYRRVPGIYKREHVKGWRLITKAIHEEGGKVFSQLWHVGRVSHPSFLDGQLPLSPSKTMMKGRVNREQSLNYGQSREASIKELLTTINDYAKAASFAMEAGFDGIEIHAANGYLLDQFLHYDTNYREDNYGGTPENMGRFPLQVIDAISKAIGEENVGIRLSPGAYLNEIKANKKDKHNFIYLLKILSRLKLAYVHTGAFDDSLTYPELDNMTMTHFIRQHYQKTLIASGSYTLPTAQEGLSNNDFDLIAFGRPFIANPDLVQKIQQKQTWQPYDTTMLKKLD
jgi:2,4-dienoyl-CoA reductase-like NADH-dependent reductase (Old Yellow Enzyme family)